MSWAEIKKSLNSDLRTPLDVLLRSILEPMETNVNKIGNDTYGLEAIRNAMKSQIYTPGTTTLATIPCATAACSLTAGDSFTYSTMKVSDNFIPVADGVVNISGSVSFTPTAASGGGTEIHGARLLIVSLGRNTDNAVNFNTEHDFTQDINLAKGTYIVHNSDTAPDYRFHSKGGYQSSNNDAIGYYGLDLTTANSFNVLLPVKKGWPVMVFIILSTYSNENSPTKYANGGTAKLTSLQVKGSLNTI